MRLLDIFLTLPTLGLAVRQLSSDCDQRDVYVYALKDASLSDSYNDYISKMASWGNITGFGSTNTTENRAATDVARKMGVAVFNDKEQPGVDPETAKCFEQITPVGPADKINATKVVSDLDGGDSAQDSWSALMIALQSDVLPAGKEDAARIMVLITDALPHSYMNELPEGITWDDTSIIGDVTEIEEEASEETEASGGAGDETTAASDETTVAGEETTAASEETTAASEETTAASEETTAASEETQASARVLQEEETSTEESTEAESSEEETSEEESSEEESSEEEASEEEAATTENPFPENENVMKAFKLPASIKDVKCDKSQGYPKLSDVKVLLEETGTHLVVLSSNPQWEKIVKKIPNATFEKIGETAKASTNSTFPDTLTNYADGACMALSAASSTTGRERDFKWWHGLLIVLGVTALAAIFAGIWELCGMGRKHKDEYMPTTTIAATRRTTVPEDARVTGLTATGPNAHRIDAHQGAAAALGGTAAGGLTAAGLSGGNTDPVVGTTTGAPAVEVPTYGGSAAHDGVVTDAGGGVIHETSPLAGGTTGGSLTGANAAGTTAVPGGEVSPDVVVPPPADARKGSTESLTATAGVGTAQGHAKDDKTVTPVADHVETRGGISALKEKFQERK